MENSAMTKTNHRARFIVGPPIELLCAIGVSYVCIRWIPATVFATFGDTMGTAVERLSFVCSVLGFLLLALFALRANPVITLVYDDVITTYRLPLMNKALF